MFCFSSLGGARERSRFHPGRAFGAVSRRAKIPSPQHPSFLSTLAFQFRFSRRRRISCQQNWRTALSFYLLNHSLQFFGQPRSNNKASGAPQFAPRSTKSQIGSPTIGRTRAVQNPQNAAHKTTARIGRTKIISATSKSNRPMSVRMVAAVPISVFVSW